MSRRLIVRGALLAIGTLLAVPARVHAVQSGGVDTANEYSNTGAIVVVQPLVNLPPWDQIPLPWVGGSGTLIHPRVMLVAGHTVEEMENGIAAGNSPDVIRVSFGPDAYDPNSWLEVEAFFTHPAYRYGNSGLPTDTHDVGIIILKEPVQGVTPAPLPEPYLLDSRLESGALTREPNPTLFTIIGYGLANPKDIRADGLRRVGTLGFQNLRADWLFCGRVERGLSRTLQGDSGGPIFWIDPETGELHLVATVTGWNRFEGHTRIDRPAILDFLGSVIEAVEAGTP